MKVKITPTGESAQVMEFNVSLHRDGQKSLTSQLQERSTYKLLNLVLFTISNTLIVKEM